MRITRLVKAYDRSVFECEESALCDYLKTQATQDMRKRLAVCYAAINDEQQVIGYYTLSAMSMGREVIPDHYQKRLPSNYEAPVILLGRLARDSRYKGEGLGELLLVDALLRAAEASQRSIGAMAVVADAKNEMAERFYGHYGFTKLPTSGKWFIALETVNKLPKRP